MVAVEAALAKKWTLTNQCGHVQTETVNNIRIQMEFVPQDWC